MEWTAIMLAGLGPGLFFTWLTVLKLHEPPTSNEDWRDPPPLFFRLARPVVNLFAHRVDEFFNPKYLELVRDKLHLAGHGYAILPQEFVVTRGVGLAFGALIFLYFYINVSMESKVGMMVVALMMPLGYFYPTIWLHDAIKRRRRLLEKQFPFFLELLVLSMRAGLNFPSALEHSADKMPQGPVATEFHRVLRDIRTGISRADALKATAKRVKIEAIQNFVAAINQAEETGGELSQILTAQAMQRRSERFRRAEALANKAPIKMLLPLLGFLFPIIFIIIFFPIIIRARETGALDFLLN